MREAEPKFKSDVPGPIRWKMMKLIVGGLLRRRYELTAHGLEHVRREGPEVSLGNHTSNLDSLITGEVLSQTRTAHVPAKEEWDKPFIGWMLKGSGALFLNRQDRQSRTSAVNTMAEKLKQGKYVHTYNSATRRKGQKLGPLISSPVVLAHKQGLDSILLVGTGGTESPANRHLHVEFARLSLAGLSSVIELSQEMRGRSDLSAYHVSSILAHTENVPILDDDKLREIINRQQEDPHIVKRQRKSLKDPVTSVVTRQNIYDIFNEQVVRPAEQAVFDTARYKSWLDADDPEVYL